ncbi:hypothetical protein EHI8A_174350 [Entamoeba histolytica HM-1:IMSS-B]|uniref:VWFA domain-containing protein n=6 Tax=Entamoeba histolytica TaxID=5759 RepID=C4M3Z4_ENTH1|nr:hypothetical protein EHI_185260 [Entamoeba histolytica HM-1:IMSS]EMD47470.1 Hypothetical protein EHI5A_198030 [Entamoeba histolytica KU27]EMH74474.1 hypothetical protein EHI8A_174350 [Entamoeba histolytica HM-1:IMSS-B]EMS17312.1 hypothetical protein KM1_245140 [Entamoeba histolytica HM-3:IMSS]ENY63625.1 hypothetical protein EHI7A_151430 [Entamoeba histolytica HM-1:IMSS-A]GAT96061.1 hypothetical protein CL6EHI_185260 [Entamoeba histolytica]|eukprot:XP_656171.1 hypothetical protein EHI_185260 [Entamoeba histolytica HM-1:IMSS]
MLIPLFIAIASALTCDSLNAKTLYSPDEAFECIESIQTTEEFNTKLLGDITTLFETYVYKDIVKNPPQPSIDSNYFTSVDIDERLKAINIKQTQLYSFYQDIQSLFFDIHDLHLSFSLESSENNTYVFDYFYYYLPFNFNIERDKKVYLSPSNVNVNNSIPEIFEKNKNIEVLSINGEPPLNFIRKYGNEHTGLKSPHGRFTYALESFNFGSLASNPLTKEFFNTPIEIKWFDDSSVIVSYKLLYLPIRFLSKRAQKALNLRRQRKVFSPIKPHDLFPELKQSSKGKFDLETSFSSLACKTYKEENRRINLLVLQTFYPSPLEEDEFFEVFEKCIQQFDSNNYPITIILPLNGGGYTDLESNFENVLAPHADTSFIGSVRVSEGTENCLKFGYASLFADPTNCSVRFDEPLLSRKPIGSWYSDPIIDHYGDVEHKRSQPSLAPPQQMLASRLVNNPRKPTDIVVFTDGFCYSACSLLTKGLREKGNAIIVGFEGDPEKENSFFDAGQSPTFVIEDINTLTPEAFDLHTYGGSMQISFFETYRFKYDYNETIPREFLLDPINERSNLYSYKESMIDSFADEAIQIINKYKNECDSNNKRLVKVDIACDKEILIEHAHGGYECGDDNKWTKKCVASYCDDGFKFDYENQKCIIDVCYSQDDSQSDNDDHSFNYWIVISFGILAILILIIALAIGLTIVIISYRKMKAKSKYNTFE